MKCSFFGKFGVLCFLEKPVLRFAHLPYDWRSPLFPFLTVRFLSLSTLTFKCYYAWASNFVNVNATHTGRIGRWKIFLLSNRQIITPFLQMNSENMKDLTCTCIYRRSQTRTHYCKFLTLLEILAKEFSGFRWFLQC